MKYWLLKYFFFVNSYIFFLYLIKKFEIKNYFAYSKQRFTNYIKFTIVIILSNKKKCILLTFICIVIIKWREYYFYIKKSD